MTITRSTRQLSVRPKSEAEELAAPSQASSSMNPLRDPPTQVGSEEDPSPSTLDVLALDMKTLVKKIQDLSHLGIEDSKIALPKICVVGDQSTGKSSLIEGISEIKVPRSAGTCTRCPMEINLSECEPGESWKCSVFLSRRYWYDQNKKLRASLKKSEPLGPWLPVGGQDDELFVTLTDQSKVQDTIWWAQLAILNPGSDSQQYVPGKNAITPQSFEVKFSPNVVRLDISGPEFPALSFYDLPGVISQAEHESETYLVTLVENLVKQYVSEENCIVLLTLSMTDDAGNSKAAGLIGKINGAKERTLGVLTKPDRLAGFESFAQYNEILEGRVYGLGHGYYVVRNNPDPDVPHAVARREEDAFFADPFWAGQMAGFQERFGTCRLQVALSAMLMEQIQKSLPLIIHQINERAHRIDAELSTLPDSPAEDVQRILMEKTITLGLKLQWIFEGGTGYGTPDNALQKEWCDLVRDFQMALEKTRPTLRTTADSDNIYLVEKYDADADMIMLSSPPSRKRKAPIAEPKTPESKPQPENQQAERGGPGYKTTCFNEWKGPFFRFTLESIRRIKEESHRAGIPNQVDPTAIEKLNKESVKNWIVLANAFVFATHGIVQRVLINTLDDVIAQYRQTGLYRELYRVITTFLLRLRSEYLHDVKTHYQIESDNPFTMAQDQHKAASLEALAKLTRARRASRVRTWRTLRGYATDEESRLSKVTDEELGPDQFSQELEMMASCRGYYQIASSRYLDVICQLAHIKMFAKCRNELIQVVNTELNASSFERCMELMAEDPERQARRNALTKEKVKLTQAQGWLAAVHQTKDESSDMGTFSDETVNGSEWKNESFA
ncbi:uncharacterized protein N7498_002480 [Penicillium cinerascens]|uniref:Dynamin family protein n=1 Tax=Penicillium cinerascens TaxID=70096 RepID=A0A9W9NA22_9EURO|nr:uncharacterized protein N7498_002480 [Penicillium cinerascens]KAJ5216073.1 hypothetical protein N7498_002480 [Penicillium cinerascens]